MNTKGTQKMSPTRRAIVEAMDVYGIDEASAASIVAANDNYLEGRMTRDDRIAITNAILAEATR